MYQLNADEQMILAEFAKRSGMKVDTDSTEFVGCYQRPRPDREEQLFFNPRGKDMDQTDRSIEILFHELVHATGIRLGRPMRAMSQMEYSYEECVAEIGSMNLMKHFGMLNSKRLSDCQQYLDQHDFWFINGEMKGIHQKADAAVEYILENWLPDYNEAYQNYRKAA